jgi:hypothetical protein
MCLLVSPHLNNSELLQSWPSSEKPSPKEMAAKSFILQGDAEPLSSAPVWAEPSQLLI